jgi:hypothetical protein
MADRLLYHYTSIETLALILRNQSICFNNLLFVDDLDEAETEDMGKFGKYVNVSCWTEDSEESIPLWNLYTPNMKGVRIGLPKFPFKKYHFRRGTYHLSNDVETYIDLEWVYNSNHGSITPNLPLLHKIEYTDDRDKLFPKVRECSDLDSLNAFIETGKIIKGDVRATYSFENLGRYKRNNWSFQKEWRYIITCSPTPIKEQEICPTIDKHREFFRRIEDKDYPAPYERIFLTIDEKYFGCLEILTGPKISTGEKIIVEALVNRYCPKATVKESKLKIR